jgi:hypothetical protein
MPGFFKNVQKLIKTKKIDKKNKNKANIIKNESNKK